MLRHFHMMVTEVSSLPTSYIFLATMKLIKDQRIVIAKSVIQWHPGLGSILATCEWHCHFFGHTGVRVRSLSPKKG